MPAFFLALIATFAAAAGGRDQVLMARLSYRLGASGSLLAAGWLACMATAAIAAAAGTGLVELLPPAGKTMLVALALLLGAVELAWPFWRRGPAEPTRSLFAIAAVLAARQVGDAARFLIVAFAAAMDSPWLAGVGGAIGGGAALAMGWMLGAELETKLPLRAIRLAIAGLLLCAAIWTGLGARGIL